MFYVKNTDINYCTVSSADLVGVVVRATLAAPLGRWTLCLSVYKECFVLRNALPATLPFYAIANVTKQEVTMENKVNTNRPSPSFAMTWPYVKKHSNMDMSASPGNLFCPDVQKTSMATQNSMVVTCRIPRWNSKSVKGWRDLSLLPTCFHQTKKGRNGSMLPTSKNALIEAKVMKQEMALAVLQANEIAESPAKLIFVFCLYVGWSGLFLLCDRVLRCCFLWDGCSSRKKVSCMVANPWWRLFFVRLAVFYVAPRKSGCLVGGAYHS